MSFRLGWLHFGCRSSQSRPPNENAPDLTGRGCFENLEHETGFEPATLTLAKRRGTEE